MSIVKTLLLFTGGILSSATLFSQSCWRHFNADSCQHHTITEYSINAPIQLRGNRNQVHTLDMAFNLGYTRQLNQQWGLGGHFFGHAYLGHRNGAQFGLRPRLAWYPGQAFEINVSPGIILLNSEENVADFPGFSFETSFNWKNHIGLVSRIDWHNGNGFERDKVHLNLGIQSRGKIGLLTGTIIPFASLLFLYLPITNSR